MKFSLEMTRLLWEQLKSNPDLFKLEFDITEISSDNVELKSID